MKLRYLFVVLAAVVAAASGCEGPKEESRANPATQAAVLSATTASQEYATKDPPPATAPTRDEAPLLLDDGPTTPTAAESMADNSRCHVCHLNLEQEELALTHARANVGCARCHGPSDAHIADESWASGGNGTAPDIMFPKEKIDAFCQECHAKEKIPAEVHNPFFAGKSDKHYCTDCHGKHRLVNRKCKWK